jgi:hypothetical protein
MGFIGLAMRSFWSDPYLWVHLAGLAALPLFLELCLIGFSVGDPFLPVWVELLLVAAVGIAPIFWMQWQRPFYIFSLVAVALKPAQLTEDQRRLLTLFKSQRQRILAVLVPVALLFVLVKIYGASAIATSVVPFPTQWRGAGLLLAAIAFLGSNLFAQVPVSVLSVMVNSESTFATTNPYPLEQIRQSFTLLGLQVNQILPPVIPDAQPVSTAAASGTPVEIAPDRAVNRTVRTDSAGSTVVDPSDVVEVETSPSAEVATPSAAVELSEETVPPSQPESVNSALDSNPENIDSENTNIEIEPAPPDAKPESSAETSAPGESNWEG